jgi:4-hydroxy-3-methylbut-2-en-1-yl diphosphate reductase
MTKSSINVYLADNQGFCAGVSNAIATVNKALKKYGSPLYIYHQIVHNTQVIKEFKEQGAIFVDSIADIPKGQRVIYSAHGVAPYIYKEAEKRELTIIDATCPLVTKVHKEASYYSNNALQTILIGHKGHQELIGTQGYVEQRLLYIVETIEDIDTLLIDPGLPIAYLTQTTLSMDETKAIIDKLHEKFPKIQSPKKKDICYATQNRQDSVKKLTEICDFIIICGSRNSSNSNRLKETAQTRGIDSVLIDCAEEFDFDLIENYQNIGISSGASVPSSIVDSLIQSLQDKYKSINIHHGESIEKNISFKLPKI